MANQTMFFNTAIAAEYGIDVAVVFEHLVYWININKDGERNKHDGDYWTYGSVEMYAKMTGYMSAAKMRKTLDKMRAYGLVKVGNYNDTAYDRTLWYALGEVGHSICESRNNVISNESERELAQVSVVKAPDEIVKTDTDKSQELDDMFTTFWAQYPRRVGKAAAQKAFKKIGAKLTEELFCQMMESLALQKAAKEWSDVQFIPHPATWLNGRRWEDETGVLVANVQTMPVAVITEHRGGWADE